MILEAIAILAFLGTLYTLYRFISRGDRFDEAKQAFYEEVREITRAPIPDDEMYEYDCKREDCYRVHLAIKRKYLPEIGPVPAQAPRVTPEERLAKLSPAQLDQLEKDIQADERAFIAGAWISKLGPNESDILRNALFIRCLGNLPLYEHTRAEVFGKFELHRRQLISDKQWEDVTRANFTLSQELDFIKREADLIQQGWGEQIFPQAFKIKRQHEEELAKRNQNNVLQRIAQAKAAATKKK